MTVYPPSVPDEVSLSSPLPMNSLAVSGSSHRSLQMAENYRDSVDGLLFYGQLSGEDSRP